MSQRQREFPDVVDLRQYLPAVAAGVRALREKEDALGDRFEPTGERLVSENRTALEELRTVLDGLGEDG